MTYRMICTPPIPEKFVCFEFIFPVIREPIKLYLTEETPDLLPNDSMTGEIFFRTVIDPQATAEVVNFISTDLSYFGFEEVGRNYGTVQDDYIVSTSDNMALSTLILYKISNENYLKLLNHVRKEYVSR